MSEAQPEIAPFWNCVGFVLLIIIVVYALFYIQRQSETLKAFPAFVAELANMKSTCESKAELGKGLIAKGRRGRNQLVGGQKLYGEAKAEIDGLVAYLKAGLVGGFSDEAASEIEGRLDDSKAKTRDFAAWADNLVETNSVTEVAITFSVSDLINEILKLMAENDARVIEKLRQDLEGCRPKSWDEI